jgi:LysM repeat protein
VLQATRSDLPATYTVRSGDSVSAIADRFGIPTPAILTLNGLGWNSVLHEGQVLKLTAEPTKKRGSSPARVAAEGYIVQYGESVSRIADRLGISTEALLRHNNMEQNTIVYAGTYLKLPGATAPTVARDSGGTFPGLAQQPTIIQASLSTTESGSAAEESTFDESATDVFDAADLPLAEKPALVTVRVAPKPATPPPAAKPTTPAPKPATTPAPATPAPAAPAATPAPAPPTSTIGQPMTGSITPLNDERRANARIIISVGRELGVPDYGIVIALATAMQESSLRNINWGDRDSLGLYQQRPSSGWGTADQIMDPAYSTRLFFGGPSNPNRGKTRGLLDIAGWQNMALTDAAQRVQISAHPQAYAKWEPSAWAWLYELT